MLLPIQTTDGPFVTGGDIMVRGLSELPILASFALINLIWLAIILWKRDRRAGIAWALTCMAWACWIVIDENVFVFCVGIY
ncbi:MAG: hypothetical protein ACHP7O_05690 [Burkholderiales bacterium]